MKKLLLFAIIVGGSLAFSACSKKECTCTVFGLEITYTEDDMTDGQSLEEFCDAGGSYCSM